MARLLVAGLLLAAATPLLAQTAPMAPSAPMAHMGKMGKMGNKVVTRAEVPTKVQTHFAHVDANRDGFVTEPEMAAMHSKMRGMKMLHHGEKGKMRGHEAMRDPNAAFDRIDANRDGSISRDEFARGHQMRIERRMIVKQSGQPGAMAMDHSRMGAMHGKDHGPGGMMGGGMMGGGMMGGGMMGGGMMGGAMFKMADANRDGKVSLAEATAGALKHFDMMDSNRDGRLTPEERAAGHARMMQMRQPG